MNKDINNLQKLYEATQEQSITADSFNELPKGYTGHVKHTNGIQYWVKNGQIHREDGPAIIDGDSQYWYKNGKVHRDDGPAIIHPSGEQSWYKNGERHRDDGPAIIGADGSQSWYKKGKVHREDGPAIIWANGTRFWCLNGKIYSREDYYRKLHKLGKISDEELFGELL